MKAARTLRHIVGAAGLDEAGRGPLAGPVVAAAVILPKGFDLEGIDDSKKLLPERREELALRIKKEARWSVASLDHREVDRLNILWASMEAMCQALNALGVDAKRIYLDGHIIPVPLRGRAKAVIDGDAKIACIAAASIIAKTTRDALMRELGAQYPEYGFERLFGYSTPEHFEALRKHGPCAIHRRTFAPVREFEQPCLIFAD
jgi:ribonuclease HII